MTLTRQTDWRSSSSSSPSVDLDTGNRFVAVYPPFSVWTDGELGQVDAVLGQKVPGRPLGLYIHVPFCERKCDYCYYLSLTGRNSRQMAEYSNRVVEELGLYAERPALMSRPLSFVYFGGGTPSLLPAETIQRLGDGLRRFLALDEAREFTFECAPRSVDSVRLGALRDIGVTRVSMGVQSFDDDILARNGRVHTVSDVLAAYALLRREAFDWLNLDLITGLVGETEESWNETLRRAVELSPDSVTVYQLEIPHNTRLYANLVDGRSGDRLPSWIARRDRLRRAFDCLEAAGYTVVNGYAAVKDSTRHRFEYQRQLWNGGDMLGLGVASYSYLDGVHFQNSSTLRSFGEHVDSGVLPLRRARRLSADERLTRDLVLGLKTGCLDAARFRELHGSGSLSRFAALLDDLEQGGWIVASNDEIRLSRSGLIHVDRFAPLFYAPEHSGVRYT